jgi:putative SOS response-associated peptidase YedK
MCERFVRIVPPEALALLFGVANPVPDARASWNIAPSAKALIMRRDPPTGFRHLVALRWGLSPPRWLKNPPRHPLSVARAEQVATSAIFSADFAVRRCLVPADAFYMWTSAEPGPRRAYAVARWDGQPMAFAGLWDLPRRKDGTKVPSFAVITTAANAALRRIAGRMPVILEPSEWSTWLDETPGDIMALLRSADPALFSVWPVGAQVGSLSADGPALLAPTGRAAVL